MFNLLYTKGFLLFRKPFVYIKIVTLYRYIRTSAHLKSAYLHIYFLLPHHKHSIAEQQLTIFPEAAEKRIVYQVNYRAAAK